MSAAPSNRTPQQALAALLDQARPQQLLLVSASRPPAIDAWHAAHGEAELTQAEPGLLDAKSAARRYDLALLVDCLEHLPLATGRELLGGIRNLNASRLAVMVDPAACAWQPTDFYAMGLELSESFARDEQRLLLFTYDLLHYKQVPDWLNARFWANPENFGKYWW